MDATNFYNEWIEPREYFEWSFYEDHYDIPRLILDGLLGVIPSDYSFKDKLLVDLGSGPGTSSLFFMEKLGFSKCIAIDSAPKMLSFFEKKVAGSGIQLQTQHKDLCLDKFDVETESIDLSVSCYAMPYLSSIDNIFSETSRIVKKSGFWCFDIHTHKKPKQRLFKEDTINHYSYNEVYVKSLAENYGFSLVSSSLIEKRVERIGFTKITGQTMIFRKD